jgi:hypothetical protein
MDIKLTFKITFVSGEQTIQEISAQTDPRHHVDEQMKALMNRMFIQYTSVGMVRQGTDDDGTPNPSKYVLLCPSQLALVECELPSIILAGANEVPKITLD